MELNRWFRKDILELQPYRCAREEWEAEEAILLDANENPLDPSAQGLNRYPHPLHPRLRQAIARWKQVPGESLFLGNGSDEAIDLLIRATCRPYRDEVLVLPPTYGMYALLARIQSVSVRTVPLNAAFQPEPEAILRQAGNRTRLLFLCSPNNPTGNLLEEDRVDFLLRHFPGLVILDEAYIDFADQPGWLNRLEAYPNLVILQTFSKAMGLAGARLGMAFAHPNIVAVLNRIKFPYNVSRLAARAALTALKRLPAVSESISAVRRERSRLACSLRKLTLVEQVYPSQANFLLVRFRDARAVFQALQARRIVVRDRSLLPGCENCLRITVGSREQNQYLIHTLQTLEATS